VAGVSYATPDITGQHQYVAPETQFSLQAEVGVWQAQYVAPDTQYAMQVYYEYQAQLGLPKPQVQYEYQVQPGLPQPALASGNVLSTTPGVVGQFQQTYVSPRMEG